MTPQKMLMLLLSFISSAAFATAPPLVTTYTYDTCQIGQLCGVTDPAGTRGWTYDGFGRIASETWVRGGVSKTTTYTWTPGDALATITYPSGRTVAYTRDAVGRITGITTNGGNVLANRAYRADGLVKSQAWANGLIETKAYDLQGRLTAWTEGTVLQRTFAYDANGNVTQKDAAQFQYDPLDRITWEPGQSLLYDGNGNRLLDAAGGYGYEAASNRMATGPPGGVVLDAAGNTLSYAGQAYAYNQAGRLTTATASGQTATYTYRHDGLRASKTVNGVTTFFHYDLNGRLIAESDAAGATLREYIWDDEVPVAQIQGGVATYLHTDALGTPRLGTNLAGAVVWAWDSDVFGATQPTGSVACNLRFPGQYFDAETGLHQNGQRTYHPPSGRYLESDPIGLAGGLNSFGYVGGNPLAAVDPDGRIAQFIWALRVLAPAATAMFEANSVAIGEPP
ncbi:MAG: RHS repeat-associated core domain-containing protein, partial [Pseudomonadota bacterium]